MRIMNDSITYLARSGYMTLQVPTIGISFGGDEKPLPDEDRPDDWFVYIKHTGSIWNGGVRPAYGKEQGYLFLSPVGWYAMRDEFKKVWESVPVERRREGDYTAKLDGRTRSVGEGARVSWEDFEREVDVFFKNLQAGADAEVEKQTQRSIAASRMAGAYRGQMTRGRMS